jgi:integrase
MSEVPAASHSGLSSPRTRCHSLRHSAVTVVLLQGAQSKGVREMLGHASVQITLDFYSHECCLLDATDERAAVYDVPVEEQPWACRGLQGFY